MGFRLSLSCLFFLIPSIAFAQPVRVSSTVATRLRGATTLPSACVAGEIYRDSDATTGQQIYVCESANTWVLQGDGGGASGWTDDGTELRLTTSTDEVEIGSAATLSAKLAVNGDADEIQLLIQGNATQTSDILVIENSAGTDILTGAAGGIKVTGNAQVTALVSCDTIDTDSGGIMRCGTDASGAGAETNSLEVITTGILTTEIPIGTAANTVVYAPLSGQATMTNGGVVTVNDVTCTNCLTDVEVASADLATTATTANAGDSATSFFASGTLEEGLLPDSASVTGWVMGASTATTPTIDDNDTSLATTAYVQGELDGYLMEGPESSSRTATFWVEPGGIGSTTEANSDDYIAPENCTASKMYVSLNTAPGAGTSWTICANVNGTVLTEPCCTISDTALTCSETVSTGAIVGGQIFNWEFAATGVVAGQGNSNVVMLCDP